MMTFHICSFIDDIALKVLVNKIITLELLQSYKDLRLNWKSEKSRLNEMELYQLNVQNVFIL